IVSKFKSKDDIIHFIGQCKNYYGNNELIDAFKNEVIEENGKIVKLRFLVLSIYELNKELEGRLWSLKNNKVGEIGGVEIIDDKKIIIKGLKISYGRKLMLLLGEIRKYKKEKMDRLIGPSAPPPLPGPCKDYINKCCVAYHACINGINSTLYENELKQCNINCSMGSCLDLIFHFNCNTEMSGPQKGPSSQDPSPQKTQVYHKETMSRDNNVSNNSLTNNNPPPSDPTLPHILCL
ncbi:7234_t:CDS:2, partial [Rhizophagus irregularis]